MDNILKLQHEKMKQWNENRAKNQEKQIKEWWDRKVHFDKLRKENRDARIR